MAKIVPTHPYLITEYQDIIISSINDPDISIRIRALDLLSAMVKLVLISLVLILTLIILRLGQSKQFAIHCTATFDSPRTRWPIKYTDGNSVADAKRLRQVNDDAQTIFFFSIYSIPPNIGTAYIKHVLSVNIRECHEFRVVFVCAGRSGPCRQCRCGVGNPRSNGGCCWQGSWGTEICGAADAYTFK